MAGKYGSASVIITVDATPGGSPATITPHVLEMGGVKIESAMELSHSFGDSWEESTPSGMLKVPDITIGGFWDTDVSPAPHAVFKDVDDGPQDGTRSVSITFGDSKAISGEARLVSYEVIASVGNLTKYSIVLRPYGTWTWA